MVQKYDFFQVSSKFQSQNWSQKPNFPNQWFLSSISFFHLNSLFGVGHTWRWADSVSEVVSEVPDLTAQGNGFPLVSLTHNERV